MSNRKISALSEIVTVASADTLPIVDASEPVDANKNKRSLMAICLEGA